MHRHHPAGHLLPPHSRPVRSPYGTPQHPLTPKAPNAPRLRFVPTLLIPALAIAAFAIVGEHLTADPDIALRSGLGFATVAGTDAVLVPYERTGDPGLPDSDRFEVRLAAVELDSGDTLWDVRLTDDAAVVAAGDAYAYLATDDGLTVLDLHDGDTIAEPGQITGLQGAPASSGAAYAFDSALGAVVALDVNGALHTIALDTLEALPAAPETAAAWTGLLHADGAVPDFGGLTATEATLADGERTVRLEPVADGALGATLAVHEPDRRRALGTRVFYGAAVVLDQTSPVSTTFEVDVDALVGEVLAGGDIDHLWTGLFGTAAGAASGHVLVEHTPDPNGTAYALNVIALDTGRVTASLDLGGHLGRAVTGLAGHVAVLATPPGGDRASDLVIVAPDGALTRVAIGQSTEDLGDLFDALLD